MIVYRLCNIKELEDIINDKSFNNVGDTFFNNDLINSFNYDIEKKYLHFFKSISSTSSLSKISRDTLCIYNIPNELFEDHKGIGYYGNDVAVEYAIPTDELKLEYLVSSYYINDMSNISEIEGTKLYRNRK